MNLSLYGQYDRSPWMSPSTMYSSNSMPAWVTAALTTSYEHVPGRHGTVAAGPSLS